MFWSTIRTTRVRVPRATQLWYGLLVLPLAILGCALPGWPAKAKPQAPAPTAELQSQIPEVWPQPARPQGGESDTVHVVHLVFEVLRVDLPIESVQHSRKIWNHVDELRIDPGQTAKLVRNGIRMGVGSGDAWPAIRAILTAAKARTIEEKLFAQLGIPVTLVVDTLTEPESIFYYDPKSRLSGRTFPGGEKLVVLDYAFRPELGGATDLQVDWEVRHDRGTVGWERNEGIIRQVPEIDRHVFSELRTVLTLRPGEFLIISPSEKVDYQYLIGGSFLTRTQDADRFETLFLITPKPFQTQEKRRPPS